MSVVANVAINVDATAAERALRNLGAATDVLNRKFQELPARLSSGLQGLGGKISGLGQQLNGLSTVMAGIGAGAAVGGFVKAGVEADRTRKTIKALADQHGETARIMQFANETAGRFGIGQTQSAKAVADLYGRLRPMGISLGDIQKTFTGVNNAAALMNLTAADTDGVMLQLSQAMGSGALQGDELRTVMERLPAVGQAIAKVMGVPVSQIKQLGAEGKITTDVIVKAMAQLANMKPPPPDAFKLLQAAMADLNTTIGTQLLPVFTPLAQKLGELVAKFKELGVASTIAQALTPLGQVLLSLVEAFIRLPAPVQQLIVLLGAIAGVVALVLAPLGLILTGVGAAITAIGGLVGALGGLSILATVAGWLGALGPALTVVVGFLMGPAGLVIAIGAVVAALIAFREPIGQFVNNAKEGFGGLVQFVGSHFVQPVINWIGGLIENIKTAFAKVFDFITAPFKAAFSSVRGIVNNIIAGVERAVNGVVNGINNMIRGANGALARLGMPQIPLLGGVSLPRFAEGGVVDQPTMAMVGEGGEAEYIIPASKMQEAMERYAAGQRGSSVIPTSVNPQVNVTTGPVMNMNGSNYVSQSDFMAGMQTASRRGAEMALQMLQSSNATRRAVGIV